MLEIPLTIQVIILAIVQGVAEFLPISSSGHLVVVEALMGEARKSTELSVMLHFGTLLAILVFYRERIWELLTENRRVIPLLIVGTLPAAVLGIYLKSQHEAVLKNPLLTGFMLVVTAFVLMAITKIQSGKKDYAEISWWPVLLIGVAQAFALLPGISRSGATIVAGAALGLRQHSAATFSFLLAIPAISGASLLEAKDIMESGSSTPIGLLALGMVVSFAIGWLALNWLVKWIEQGRLHWFAYWLLPFGFFVIVWQLNVIVRQSAAFY